MIKLHYFAYGSNLHPLRLQERVPSATVIGVVEAEGRKLTFSKRSKDGSGKCNFFDSENSSDVVYGVLYEINSSEKGALDRAEGKGYGYHEQLVSFELEGVHYCAFTYVADSQHIDSSLLPYEWYKRFVIEGAKYHSFPDEYILSLEEVSDIPDPDAKRASENMARLQAMQEFNKAMHATGA
jgi:gamma-glutamylcyclotransferase